MLVIILLCTDGMIAYITIATHILLTYVHICFYSAILVLYKVCVYKVYTDGIHVTIATYLHSTLQLVPYRPIVLIQCYIILILYEVCVYKASVAVYNNYYVCADGQCRPRVTCDV